MLMALLLLAVCPISWHPSVGSVSAFAGHNERRPFHLVSPYSSDKAKAPSRRSFWLHESIQSTTATTQNESAQTQQKQLSQVDVLYGRRQSLVYDPTSDRYVSSNNNEQPPPTLRQRLQSSLSVALLPTGITPNYYRFITWRILQRFVNANLHVFGTQSLLMGLGIGSLQKSHRALSAALTWVLKDALGKLCRVWWASKMGRRFDADAKRWRFRSSLLYAGGNCLEIVTYLFPQWFLLFATCANSFKQVSMLTASSTRTAIYNSFRDYKTQNIGDITAKGEAQIAIVDLLGIASGVSLSNAIGTSAIRICTLYVILQVFEIICMYRELRAVQYRLLNFERMIQVMESFCDGISEQQQDQPQQPPEVIIPTPSQLAVTERIFLPPRRLARRANAFGSLSRARLSPQELDRLLQIFHRERFLLVVGANIKKQPHQKKRRWLQQQLLLLRLLPPPLRRQWLDQTTAEATRRKENCHIVLHEKAENIDIVKSTLALTLLRRRLASSSSSSLLTAAAEAAVTDSIRSSECMDMIEDAYIEADRLFARLLRVMSKTGWESPARFMFGRVHMRADWPLMDSTSTSTTTTTSKTTTPVVVAAVNGNVTRLTNGLQ